MRSAVRLERWHSILTVAGSSIVICGEAANVDD